MVGIHSQFSTGIAKATNGQRNLGKQSK